MRHPERVGSEGVRDFGWEGNATLVVECVVSQVEGVNHRGWVL